MEIELKREENLVEVGFANLQKNIETVGGKLYLTNQRLVFEAHKFNLQRKPAAIALSYIKSIQGCWTKFLGLVPLFPNSISIHTQDGKEYRFVLFRRNTWIKAIKEAIERYNCE